MSDVDVLALAKARISECDLERQVYDSWLARLKRVNLITVIVPVTLSTIAGAAILGDLLGSSTTTVAGIAALLGGILTAVHKGLRCDEHQAECLRLASGYFGLKTRYESFIVDGQHCAKDLGDINLALAQLRESVQATVPARFRSRVRERAAKDPASDYQLLIEGKIRRLQTSPATTF